jgi:histidine triad (HIT) family protein
MSSIFTRIINREIPAYIVYEDDICIAILDIRPTTKGCTLVIPKQETSHWIDMDMTQYLHCQQVAQSIAKALFGLYHPIKV